MQQQPRPRSQAFPLFGTYALEDIPKTYFWFEEMRLHHPVFQDERTRLWQVFRYEDVLAVLTDYTRFSSQAYEFTGGFLKTVSAMIAYFPHMIE
jgi:cytochrome P450